MVDLRVSGLLCYVENVIRIFAIMLLGRKHRSERERERERGFILLSHLLVLPQETSADELVQLLKQRIFLLFSMLLLCIIF